MSYNASEYIAGWLFVPDNMVKLAALSLTVFMRPTNEAYEHTITHGHTHTQHTHRHTHTHMHTHISTHTHMYTHTHAYTYTHTDLHSDDSKIRICNAFRFA